MQKLAQVSKLKQRRESKVMSKPQSKVQVEDNDDEQRVSPLQSTTDDKEICEAILKAVRSTCDNGDGRLPEGVQTFLDSFKTSADLKGLIYTFYRDVYGQVVFSDSRLL